MGGAEGLFQEPDADAVHAADITQGRGGPGLPLNHLGKRASRTGTIQPSCTSPAVAWSRNAFWSRLEVPCSAGRVSYARPKAASTFRACLGSKRSTAATFRCDRSISRSRMKRVAAIQKSSRTRQRAWTCSPSHCRSAATSPVPSSRLAGATARTGRGPGSPCDAGGVSDPAQECECLDQSGSPGQSGNTLRRPRRRPASVSPAVASTYTGVTCAASRGSSPAFTSDDLPHPDGP